MSENIITFGRARKEDEQTVVDVRDDGNKIGVMWKTDGDWTFSPDHGSPVGVGTKLADAKACVIEEMESLEDGGEEVEAVGSVVKRKVPRLVQGARQPATLR